MSKVTPFLMFQGNAEEAMNYYTSIIEESKITSIMRYGANGPGLPVYGVAEIGGELRPASRGDEPSSGLLLEGTIDIFARTLELSAMRDTAPRIYPASSGTITIPPGLGRHAVPISRE
jgi:uncharacterized glyoxalase superfamily protein PhnB